MFRAEMSRYSALLELVVISHPLLLHQAQSRPVGHLGQQVFQMLLHLNKEGVVQVVDRRRFDPQ
eukprot:2191016-Karenia_brevis.AAC.1